MKNELTEIGAYIYDKKIGTLVYHQGIIYFEYDKDFIKSGIEISPLKLQTSNTIGLYKGLPGVFLDSLPDKHGIAFIDRYFQKKGLKSNQITLLHKLAFIGDRGMGAIEYKPKEHEKNKDTKNVMAAKEAYEDMKRVLNNKDEISSIDSFMNIIDSVSPVGGGRPKMLITYNKKTNTFKFNNKKLIKGYKRAIIKFDEVYYENESMNFTKIEYVYMQIAKECGIKIPPIALYEENGQFHLIIERFDRDENDNKVHICTASGLMHIDISVAQIMSYEQLFAFTRKICNNQMTIEELFRRMVFNALSFNFDDHAKNFSFLMLENGKWDLSPAYDITYSKGLAKEHITTINAKGLEFTLEDFLKVAKAQSISKNSATKIIQKISKELKTFEKRAKAINVDAKSIQECKEDIESQLQLVDFQLI